MALLSVIRRWHLRDGMAIREIARRTGLSRNTIRKYLSSGIVEPKYPERQSPSKLDAFAPKLASWLKTEAKKSRKQRRNLRQLYADLAALMDTAAAEYAREVRARSFPQSSNVYAAQNVPVTPPAAIAKPPLQLEVIPDEKSEPEPKKSSFGDIVLRARRPNNY